MQLPNLSQLCVVYLVCYLIIRNDSVATALSHSSINIKMTFYWVQKTSLLNISLFSRFKYAFNFFFFKIGVGLHSERWKLIWFTLVYLHLKMMPNTDSLILPLTLHVKLLFGCNNKYINICVYEKALFSKGKFLPYVLWTHQ